MTDEFCRFQNPSGFQMAHEGFQRIPIAGTIAQSVGHDRRVRFVGDIACVGGGHRGLQKRQFTPSEHVAKRGRKYTTDALSEQ